MEMKEARPQSSSGHQASIRTSTASTSRESSIERLADSVRSARRCRRWKKSVDRAFEDADLDPEILRGLRECASDKSIERLEARVALELALVEVTSRDVDDASIATRLDALTRLDSRNERNVQVLTDIIASTRQRRPVICAAAARALASPDSSSSTRHLHKHVEALLIPLLSDSPRAPKDATASSSSSSAVSAALILRDIALENREIVRAAVPVLCARVIEDEDDDELMDACCRCLWNLTFRDEENKENVRPVISNLISIFRRNQRGPAERWSTCEASAGLLANLVRDRAPSSSSSEDDLGLTPSEIVEVLELPDTPLPVREALTRLLGSLVGRRRRTNDTDAGLDADEKRSVIRILVDMLGDSPKKKQRSWSNNGSKTAAATTLQQLALDYECKLDIATMGGVDALACAFRSKTADDTLKTAICLALATLCRDSVKNEALVVAENDLVWPVCVFLRKRNDAGQEAAAILLGRLALDFNARSQIVLSEAIKPLAGILAHGTDDAKHAAATVLWNLALDDEFHEDMISSGTILPLCILVDQGTPKARLAAAGALKFLTHTPSVRRTVFDAWDLGKHLGDRASLTEKYIDDIIDARATTTHRIMLSRSLSSWCQEIPELEEEKTVVIPSRAVMSKKRTKTRFFASRFSLNRRRT